jgi:hypothetical protein
VCAAPPHAACRQGFTNAPFRRITLSIPGYAQWIKDTEANVFSPRSSRLKAVDEAIQQYEKTKNEKDLWRIKNAFEDWKRDQGAGWENSVRNRVKAVTKLNASLNTVADYRTYQITHFTIPELVGLSVIAKERKKAITKIFESKEVTFKAAKLKDQLKLSAQKIKETAEQSAAYLTTKGKTTPPKTSGPPASDVVRRKMEDMVKTMFSVDGLEALGSLGGFITTILGQCAVSIPPVVGHIKDGYDLFTGWAKVGSDLYQQYNISERGYAIDTGVPTAAFDALKSCLEQETKNEAVSASRATASFALKTGLVFVDGGAISGPVVGAANALADFAHQIYLLATEYKATKAINVALTAGELDIRLFRSYPLMGCYFLVSATLSDLIPIDSFGSPGWMDYIENLHKHGFEQIYKSSIDLIEKSPWEMEGLPKRPKGTSAGIFTEVKRIFSTVSPLGDLKDLKDLS